MSDPTDPFPAPIDTVRATDTAADSAGPRQWVLHLPADQREVVAHLLGELRALLRDGDPDRPPLVRLFPPVYVDDEEKEAEYRRLMRDELITSRLAQIDAADALLGPDGPERFSEADTIALMQSINAVRVVLGTILDVTDDEPELIDEHDDRAGEAHGDSDDDDSGDDADGASTASQLYDYLSWLLEWVVRSLDT